MVLVLHNRFTSSIVTTMGCTAACTMSSHIIKRVLILRKCSALAIVSRKDSYNKFFNVFVIIYGDCVVLEEGVGGLM